MEVILLKEVDNLGTLGDIVNARDGYARNYLIPYGLALFATPENKAKVEERKVTLRAEIEQVRAACMERKKKLDGVVCSIEVETKDGIDLFGSVGTNEIIKSVKEMCGEDIHKNEIILPDGAYRKVGTYQIDIKLHSDIMATITLTITSSGTVADNMLEDESITDSEDGENMTTDTTDA